MAKATITIDDKVDGSIGILCEAHNPGEEESGAVLIAQLVMDMLQNLLELGKVNAELSKVSGEDGRL